MPDHLPLGVERHCDVAVIGGSAAGLAAALQLVRQRRSVIVVDSGQPRNRPAGHVHGYLGREAVSPADLLADEREEVRSYGGEILPGYAADVGRTDDGRFRVELAGGNRVTARRLVAATGVIDQRPDIAGLATGPDGHITSVELSGGRHLDADAVVVGPRFEARAGAFAALGLRTEAHPSGMGDFVPTDANGLTAVPGLYAAGNLADPGQQVLQAATHGSRVGAMISFDLADEDLRAPTRPSATQVDWDHRYSGQPLWSGNPNGTLVNEITGLPPGRALDVGAGEGGDAVWLAEQGWSVTAADISPRALGRIGAEAGRRGLHIERRLTDANALNAFDAGAYDLVTAFYASIPRTPDGRGVGNVVDAVAPGGTLLVVSHDLEPMRAPVDPAVQSRPFDPDAYVRVDDVAAALTGRSGWDIEVRERRPRPPGAATAAHHVDDVVLRARRRGG